MNKRVLLLLLILLAFSAQVYAECTGGQIDINSASLEELDQITHVGNKTAQKIIDMRPFNSIEELDKVPYISPGYVEDIITQGLACVTGAEETEEDNEEPLENSTVNIQQLIPNEDDRIKTPKKPITSEMISLTPPDEAKDIKTNENVLTSLTSDRIAIYGLVGFCMLLGVLFAAKKIKKPKTEFEK